jgi:hypothetical protein
MGSAAGFHSVIRSVPIVDPALIKGHALWEDKPLRLSILDPDTPELLQAAAVIDTAALTGKLAETASAWPLCSLSAATHHYGPALRAISVLMQNNPQASLPLPPPDELRISLLAYRRYLGDLPDDSIPDANQESIPEPAATPAVSAAATGGSPGPADANSR